MEKIKARIDKLDRFEQYSIYRYLDEKWRQDPLILPHELILKITSYLEIKDILKLKILSKRWYKEMNGISWKDVYCLLFPLPNVEPIDWLYLTKQRILLEQNWKFSRYKISSFGTHLETIYAVFLKGKFIYTGSRDTLIKCWNLDGDLLKTYHGHSSSVLCIYVGDFLYSGSSDNSIIEWDIHTATIRKRYHGHSEPVLRILCCQGNLVSCSKDKTIKVWNLESGQCKTLIGHTGSVNALQMNQDVIISGSSDKTIKIWSMETCQEQTTLLGHQRGIVSLELDERRIISGSSDGEFRVWNFQGQVLHTIQAHSELVRTLSLVGHKLISGSYDKQIKVWDLATMKQTLLIRNIPDVGQIVTLQATDTKIIVSMVNANHLYLIDFSENIDISVL